MDLKTTSVSLLLLQLFFGLAACFLYQLDNENDKKGISITHWEMLCGDFNTFRGHVSWWYDLEPAPEYWTTLSQFSGCGPLLENRVPMVWGWYGNSYLHKVPDNTIAVLGYNEPDRPDQANISAIEAARHWPAIQAQAGNRTLVSPSPTKGPYFRWMDEFLLHCGDNCRVDYMAAHIYECNPDSEMEFLEHIYRKYNRKIWVTEFACPYKNSLQAQLDYMQAILPRLEAAPFVVRYSWFIARWKGDWFIPQAASLLEQDSSQLTPLGRFYLNFNSKK